MKGKYIVGLDIGTTKVCVVAGRVLSGQTEIIGLGLSPSGGIRKGVVVDINATVDSIKKAVSEAESSSGLSIRTAYVGIAGSHIKCIESYGAVGIKGNEVTRQDVQKVIDSAASVYVPLDREVLHILPSDFIIDGQEGIVQPVSMSGVRLEAKVSIVTTSLPIIENLMKCCEKAGIRPVDIVLEPIASSMAVLKEEEMQSGVALIDMGGGTTDIAIYKDKRLRHTSVIPIGGNHITNDIAIGLRVSQKEAERLKKTYGTALVELFRDEMEIFGMNGEQRKNLPRKYIAEIIKPRCEELFSLIKTEIGEALNSDDTGRHQAKEHMLYSSVLTGGTSLLPGIDRVAEAIVGLAVRGSAAPDVNMPSANSAGVASPMYSTAIGLMLYGIDMESKTSIHESLIHRVSGIWRGWDMFGIKESLKVLTSKIF
ncbi:MAG: cell division protein FtsA [Nitrospirae bacterium]|nr:cell division protein FtsA [Nitrospirota bacterium]